MSNYKVLVRSELDRDQAIGLFQEFGYFLRFQTPHELHEFVCTDSYMGIPCSNIDDGEKEITIPELRDLVVLKRNDVGDATHKGSITDNVYYVSSDEEVYRFESSAWCFSTVIVADLKPIEKPMKEYLIKSGDGKYLLTHHDSIGAIEIPEGSNIAVIEDSKVKFYSKYTSADLDHLGKDLIWMRPSHPEELPFIDDECYTNKSDGGFRLPKDKPCDMSKWVELRGESLNDQYAEIEKVRQHNHYFKDVSSLNEIDVYMVLKLFNVTDPCLQHIAKKALCAGQRGHRNFNCDLRDILDTAKRAVEINNG